MYRRSNYSSLALSQLLRGPLARWLPPSLRKTGATAGDPAAADVRSRLSSALPEFEQICVNGGEKLETLCRGSAQLVTECETLLKVASGREDGESLARETLQILAEPLRYIDFCQERHGRLLQLLQACEEKTRSMIAVRESMHATLAPLTYMTVLFKIESASLPEEFRETFQNVTTEIERMRLLVDETFAKNAALLASTHATLSAVRISLERDFRAQFANLRERRRHIDDAIQLLDTELTGNNHHNTRLQDQSQSIAGEVARIVAGLQFQDIVQQKCDHVLQALATWEQTAPSAPAVRLQALQLEGAAHDLSSGHESVSAGLRRIGVTVDQIDQNSQRLDELQGMTAAADGMVQRLLDAIAEVHAMITGLAETTEKTHEAIRPAGEITNSLSSTLVELSTNMRLIALNAQIRSVQIGELTGLETLASRTATISHEIDDVSEASSHALVALRHDLNDMLATFEEFNSRGREQIAALSESRIGTEARLHAMRDRAIQSVQKIAISVGELKTCAQDFDLSLAQLPTLQSEIAAAAQSLHELSTRAAPAGDADLTIHAGRYTMATERATHAALTGKIAAPVDDIAPEIFVEPAPATTSAESATTGDSQVPVKTATHSAPRAGSTPADTTPLPLGANVELF